MHKQALPCTLVFLVWFQQNLLKNNTLYIQALLPWGSITSHLALIILFTNLYSLS